MTPPSDARRLDHFISFRWSSSPSGDIQFGGNLIFVEVRLFYCVDVDYRSDRVVAAAVGFHRWTDDKPAFELVAPSWNRALPYQAGQFYRREMPYLLELLRRAPTAVEAVIIDGFVWLGPDLPGLGAHLFDALGGVTNVVGIAKRPHKGSTASVPVLRGQSSRPLFVSAVGMALEEAARGVSTMHGPYRIPALVQRTDRLSRDG